MLLNFNDQILINFIYPSKIHSDQLLINRREKQEIENLKNLIAFIDYSQTIDEAYKNLKDCN